MDENKTDDDPALAEVPSEESDTGITVKLPSGKTIKMLSPYDDEGEVPWLVPKDERDFDFYEISWDLLIDDDYRRSKQGKVVVLCRQQISDSWFDNLGNGVPHPDKVYKSRYDTFNGKHIIENILGEEIPKAPSPEKPDDLAYPSNDKIEAESLRERPVPRKPKNLPKERKTQKKNNKREKLSNLLNKLQRLQILQEDETPKVVKWMMTKIEREKMIEEEEKRRRRLKKKKRGRKEIFASLWGEAGSNRYKETDYDEHYEEEEQEEEDVGGWGEFEEAAPHQRTILESQFGAGSDMEPRDKAGELPTGSHSQQEAADSSKTGHSETRIEDEEFEAEIEGEFGEEESLEDITFSDLEKEEEFFKAIEQRYFLDKRARSEYMQQKQWKMFEKLKKMISLEKSKITPEYIETLNILKVRNNRELLFGWEPLMEFPSTTCIGNSNLPEEDPCHRQCFPKRGGECKCDKTECKARTEGLCVNQPSEDEVVDDKHGMFVTGVEARLPGEGKLMLEAVTDCIHWNTAMYTPEAVTLRKLFPQKKERIPRAPHFCVSGRISMTPFEMRNKYPLWIEEMATYYDNIRINSRIREAALARGWINSPYYQFGVDSGIILAPTDQVDRDRIEEFKQRPDYGAKKAEFGRILENGVLSQERMQELVLLGVTEQDPFIKDYLDFAQSKREWQESENAEIEWNLENNPEVYNGEFPPDIMNPEATDELEEAEDELSPEDRIRRRKEDFLKNKVEVAMNFNQDKSLNRWDDMRFYFATKRRQEKMKELSGDTKIKVSDEELKKIFGHCAFDYAWVHPKNFRELMTHHEEKKLKRMYPFTEDPKTLTEFQQFLTKWRDQWRRVKKIVVQQSVKNRKEFHRRVADEKLAMYERAFKKRLETCEVIGRPPKFLLKALLRKHERKNSYLNFLLRMKKIYLSQQKTDKKDLKKFITCLEKFLEIIDTEKRKKRELKMAKMRKMGSFDGEEAEEEEDFRRREISLKHLTKKQREKKKLNVDLMWNKKYTKEDFEARRFLKGPVRIDKELKGMSEKQVEQLYLSNKVPLSPDIDPQVFFVKWYSDDKPDCTKNHFPTTFKVDKRLGPTKNSSVMNYMSMLNVAKMVELDPYDLKFLPNAGHYLKPIYYIPEGLKAPTKILANYKNERKENEDGGGGDGKEARAEKPFFSNELLDVWRSRTVAPESRKKLKVLDLIKEEATGERQQKKNENQGADLDEEQESGIILEPEEAETEGEMTNALPDSEVDKPWTCPRVESCVNYNYDPYACLRNKPRISRKERAWYRSARERERRSFRSGQTSFMKYIDINKLNCNPEHFKVWKMASSGILYRGMKRMNPEFAKDEKLHGVGEIWNWDAVGGGMVDEVNRENSLADFKSTYFPREDQRTSWDRKPDDGRQLMKAMLEDYKLPVDHHRKDKEEEQNDPPTSYVVFSSITLPPFVERRSFNRRYLHDDIKVEDRKLFKILQSCGTIIFDITRSRHDLYLCCWYLRKLLLKMEKAEQLRKAETVAKNKLVEKVIRNKKESAGQSLQNVDEPYRPMQRIILITSFVSWARSPEDVKAEINEQTFYKRKPHPDYFDYYTCENLLYRIGRRKPYNICTTVLFAGLPFGFEEDGLVYVFKMAYENRREIPIYGPGENLPPMIHVQDLSKIVISLMKAEKPPLVAFAVHPTDLPLKTRVFNIATQMSYSHVRTQPTPYYLWNNILPKTVHDILQLNFTQFPVTLLTGRVSIFKGTYLESIYKYTRLKPLHSVTLKYKVSFKFKLFVIASIILAYRIGKKQLKISVNIIIRSPYLVVIFLSFSSLDALLSSNSSSFTNDTSDEILLRTAGPESVDNHPLMGNPKIPSPFSPGVAGYSLLLELKQSRGMSPTTVLFLGPPTQMKWDLAKSISVFYNIPLLTRRNIMKEWMKLLQQMTETDAISNLYNKASETEEQAEKEDDKLKTKDLVLEEMKQVVNDNNNCDVNRNWLLLTLHIILRTVRYREIGYVLCDIPLSEKDAGHLFNNRTNLPDPRPFDFVADTVVMPKTIIYMDTMHNDAHEAVKLPKDKDMSDDWQDFWKYKSKQADAQEFFKKRLHKVHRVTTRDEFLLERVIQIIGPPMRPGGSLMYQSLFSHMLEDKTSKPEEQAQVAHVRQFFSMMQQKGLDLAAGITHQCLPTLTDWPKQKLKYSLQPYYAGFRHYPTKKQTLRSAAGPYREVRRKWSKKSRFFNQMPTEGNRVMWRKARKFWSPQDKTKEYIVNFEATSI